MCQTQITVTCKTGSDHLTWTSCFCPWELWQHISFRSQMQCIHKSTHAFDFLMTEPVLSLELNHQAVWFGLPLVVGFSFWNRLHKQAPKSIDRRRCINKPLVTNVFCSWQDKSLGRSSEIFEVSLFNISHIIYWWLQAILKKLNQMQMTFRK